MGFLASNVSWAEKGSRPTAAGKPSVLSVDLTSFLFVKTGLKQSLHLGLNTALTLTIYYS